MIRGKALSVAKSATIPDSNEDYWVASSSAHLWVVADGASNSYAARKWAMTVAHQFLSSAHVDENWLSQARMKYLEIVRPPQSWAQEWAFQRGSFSTLLAAEYMPQGQLIRLTAVGDSVAFHFSNDMRLIDSFPYRDPVDFKTDPFLLPTRIENNWLKSVLQTEWCVDLQTEFIVLATDAIAAWLLNSPSLRIADLLSNFNSQSFANFVFAEQENLLLERDDCTAIIITGANNESI